MKKPLNNISLWITRPAGQADNLSQMLKAKGAQVLHLPMMQIERLAPDAETLSRVKKLKKYDMVFFISTNAAQSGMELLERHFSEFPDEPAYFAPGATTAKVLKSYGLKAFYPEKAMNTEGLLILPEIRKVLQGKTKKKKKALIFRGKGGRELLARTLNAKGVEVDYIELYKRTLPQFKESYLKEIVEKKMPDGIVFSSAEAIHNFVALFENVYPEYRKLPVFVSSERLQILSKTIGFETITVLKAADDAAVISGMEKAHE